MTKTMINIEVIYALPSQQAEIILLVAEGTTALQAALASGIGERFALDLKALPMGIYSKRLDGRSLPLPQDYVLADQDRVEIYRPLTIDPNQARLQRAARARQQNK